MKYIFTNFCLLLTFTVSSFAQETKSSDSIYLVQDNVLIPTKSGIDISAIIVRKQTNTEPLLQPNKKENIPFDDTRFVSKKINKGSRLGILVNINKHPFEIINYGSGKSVSEETIQDAGEPLQINWHNHSYIKIPLWKN